MTEAAVKNPHSVILLDEIEKAHPEVFNVLLQVMDHGTLTDNNGRVASFKNIVLIMTTNSGAQEMARNSMGFQKQDNSSDGAEVIKKAFSPEFRNRLDATVVFKKLAKEVLMKIVGKFMVDLKVMLKEKNVAIELTNEAIDYLVEHGYDDKMGARPMQRLIDDKIKKDLSKELLFGKLKQGGKVKVSADKKGIVLDYSDGVKLLEKQS